MTPKSMLGIAGREFGLKTANPAISRQLDPIGMPETSMVDRCRNATLQFAGYTAKCFIGSVNTLSL
jgi:hypothetical protein